MVSPVAIALASIVLIVSLVIDADGYIRTDTFNAARKLDKTNGLSNWIVSAPSRVGCAVECARVRCSQFVWKMNVCHLNLNTCGTVGMCFSRDKQIKKVVVLRTGSLRPTHERVENITQGHCYVVRFEGACLALGKQAGKNAPCLVFQFILRKDGSYAGQVFETEQILYQNGSLPLLLASVTSEDPNAIRFIKSTVDYIEDGYYELRAPFVINFSGNIMITDKEDCE